jgi:microcompartment protein CcmK/EutM
MILGKVAGTVVSSSANIKIPGARFLLIDKCDQKGERKGDYLVALDLVSAGINEMVFIAESTSARETAITSNKPIDAIVIGIIDMIDEHEKIVYKK